MELGVTLEDGGEVVEGLCRVVECLRLDGGRVLQVRTVISESVCMSVCGYASFSHLFPFHPCDSLDSLLSLLFVIVSHTRALA